MASLNHVVLMGNLTRDPELRTTPGGVAVVDLGLAISDNYKNKAGENVENTCFVDVVAWGRQAETCGQYLNKGSPVLVEGRLQYDQWENKDGEKRSKLRVNAMRVQFLSSPKRAEYADESAGQGSGENPPPPPPPGDSDTPF